LDELVRTTRAINGVSNVVVLRLEDRPLREQLLEVACGNTVVAGAHGAGLAWTEYLGELGFRSGLVEWHWFGWRSPHAGMNQGAQSMGTLRTISRFATADLAQVVFGNCSKGHDGVGRGGGPGSRCCCPNSRGCRGARTCLPNGKGASFWVNSTTWIADVKQLIHTSFDTDRKAFEL
jgi:hypothetical protein